MTNGERLRKAFDEKGRSVLSVSRATGISEKAIRRILNGDTLGYLDTWVRVCDELGVGLGEIVRRDS